MLIDSQINPHLPQKRKNAHGARTLLTVDPLEPTGLTDRHFFMNDKERLQVILTPESILSLAAAGYTNDTSIYSTLVAYNGDPSNPDDPSAIATPAIKRMPMESDACYTLQGQRVTTPQKGRLYIRNGQKFIYR